MELSGIEAAASAINREIIIARQVRDLIELQGEMVVKLINSSKVPGPSDFSDTPELGGRLDIHA
jgi:hypothetical protein